MSKGFAVSMVALIAGLAFSPVLRGQTAPPNAAGDDVQQEKWNNVPPPKSAYAGKKSAPAPRRDISGIWDAAAEDGGRQVSGASEHPALLPQGKVSKRTTRPNGRGYRRRAARRDRHHASFALHAFGTGRAQGQ